ncbi:hypothetical protein GPECTOR_22g893 [Gonium pectorale]|uniref:Uncharacterized protein n=1 Tax=Gonium pectorale TaxID=33097 RepID=A0A150GHM5_GONPE|nr:hypothetical protein GPECTOR_22g893 [Gonium pectorale]|eukprot:KXZ49299.1 hypothetical protein GPECTOR_22g893 [Gonium pectorale]
MSGLRQDLTAQPGKGRGIWLSSQLWHAVTKQLESQVSEVDALLREVRQKEKEAGQLRQELEAERLSHQKLMSDMQTQITEPLSRVAELEAELQAKQAAWDKHKKDLSAQADELLRMLQERQGLADDNEGLLERLGREQAARHSAERRAAEAEAQAAELQRLADYAMGKAGSGLSERDAQAMRIRDLSAALADARLQADDYRRQLAGRTAPLEQLTTDLKRLRADNRRLVALLAAVPEYRAMAAEMGAYAGVSYMPLEECLMARELVEDLYPQQLDRWAPGAALGA